MKFLSFLFSFLLLSTFLAFAQEKTKPFDYVIFPAQFDIYSMGVGYDRCELIDAEAICADTYVWVYLDNCVNARELPSNVGQLREIITRGSANYKRQFFGLKDKEGHTIVWCNYFYNASARDTYAHWHRNVVQVKNGGSGYFNIKVDMNTGRVFDLAINGDA